MGRSEDGTSPGAPPPWTERSLAAYLESIGYRDVRVLRQVDLGGSGELKEFGYGRPVLVEIDSARGRERLVLHTLSADTFGHDRRSDRAQALLLAHETFNDLPRHVRSYDVGAFRDDGALVSLGRTGEFFLLTEYAPGRLYAEDLGRLREAAAPDALDEERALALADYLAEIHRVRKDAPAVYHRRIRDLVGHGEGLMGLTDSYPADFPLAGPDRLERIETKAVRWRWRLRDRTHRLRQVHGDFHPFNILFGEGTDFRLLDRSRGAWGEPADDVTALSINYLFFALQSRERFEGALRALWDRFWNRYLERSGDEELLEVAAPFFAWRTLVVASPLWYPSLSEAVRGRLFAFLEAVLDEPRFRPDEVDRYLEGP